MTAPSNWNSASVVAIIPHKMQNPEDFFVLDIAGLVSKGFITDYVRCCLLYVLVISYSSSSAPQAHEGSLEQLALEGEETSFSYD